MILKAITLWQPWAQLVALGEKRYETRSWGPYTLGPIAIHAASKRTWENMQFFQEQPFRSVFARHGITSANQLAFGAVIAMARIACCHPVEPLRGRLSVQERALGDYRDGRKAWELVDVKPLRHPIPIAGQQGIWDWEAPEGLLQNYLQTTKETNYGPGNRDTRRRPIIRPIPDCRDD
jgi:hypothetical protein